MRLAAQMAGYAVLVVVATIIAVGALWLLIVVATGARADCDERFPHCVGPGAQQWNSNAITMPRGVVGGRPRGCPRRYCGCGLSIKLFGRIIPRLNLAANWLVFPRAAPGPGVVAARRGHVMLLLSDAGSGKWLVYDPNSGRGLTRVHVRSVAGFRFVNPRAGGSVADARKAQGGFTLRS